jgi:hypothetical protein
MNSSINEINNRAYHTVANAEFTCAFDRMVFNHGNINAGNRIGSISDYHLFIRYGDKVYIEVKNIGEIVISFDELQKNRYLKYYYDLSHMLTNNKNLIIQDLKYNTNYNDHTHRIYNEQRFWSIDTAFIELSMYTKTNKVFNNENICYYKINPYDLENMEYTSNDDLNTFKSIYMTRCAFRNNVFDKVCVINNNLVIDYNARLIEKELDELSEIIEDKKNVINLATLYYKEDMTCDLLMIMYNNLISDNGNKKYAQYMTNTGTYNNRLELVAQIISA